MSSLQSIIFICKASIALYWLHRNTAEEYRNYLEQDFSDVDINEMTDLRMIKADRNKSLQERRDIFLNKVGNPYLVRIGNMKVKVRFANNGISMEQAFENMLLSV